MSEEESWQEISDRIDAQHQAELDDARAQLILEGRCTECGELLPDHDDGCSVGLAQEVEKLKDIVDSWNLPPSIQRKI